MIDIIETVIAEINEVDGLKKKVYRKWPARPAKGPSCLVQRISATPVFTDASGAEIRTQLVYSIEVNAKDADEADRLASDIIDRLARFNLHRSGDMELYDDISRNWRRIITVMGTVDVRGNTFTD